MTVELHFKFPSAAPSPKSSARLGPSQRKKKTLHSLRTRIGAEQSGIEGTGLGLASPKGWSRHGGAIGVESDFGRGSIFSVELPGAENRHPAPRANRCLRLLKSKIKNPKSKTKKTVLYVEDNLSNLRLIDRILAGNPASNCSPPCEALWGSTWPGSTALT